MALLPSGDPAVASSLTHSSTTAAAQKLNFTALRTFISDLLGVDSADKAAARTALGAIDANSAQSLTNKTLNASPIGGTTPAAGAFTSLSATGFGQIDGGLRASGTSVIGAAAGPALEAGYSSGGAQAYIQGYNRTSNTFVPLAINGGVGTFSSTGLAITGALSVAGANNAISLTQSVAGSATYYVMDNTVEVGGKRWRFGYTGGAGATVGGFSLFNQTDNATVFNATSAGFAVTGALSSTTTIETGGYTVATLPAGAVGQRAYVTDAAAPTYLAAVAGGGAVRTPVFRNATVWVSA